MEKRYLNVIGLNIYHVRYLNIDKFYLRSNEVTEMKKVMFLIESFNYGGVGKVLYDLVRLLNNNYEITIYVINNTGVYKDMLPSNIKFKYILNKESRFKRKLFNFMIYRYPNKFFYKMFIRGKYDVEIAFMENYPTKIISCSPNKHSKKIAWIHTDLIKNTYSDSIYNSINQHKEAYEKFNDIVCVSKSAQEAFETKFHIVGNVKTIYNPIIMHEIIKKSQEGGFTDKYTGIRILTIGRLSREKGQDIVIKVALKLKKNGYNFRWYLVGDGNIRTDLERDIKRYVLMDNLILLGARDNPYSYLKQCDIYVQPSRYEGYCMSLQEAIIFRKPIVSTDFSGAREQLENKKTGLIVEVNEEKIFEAISKLINNKELRVEFSENLKTKSFNNNSLERVRLLINS